MEKQSRAYGAAALPAETVATTKEEVKEISEPKKKLWYCTQCGYVVFRDEPPYVCPICKAKREMFAEIKTRIEFSV
jgi:rubrerythrin